MYRTIGPSTGQRPATPPPVSSRFPHRTPPTATRRRLARVVLFATILAGTTTACEDGRDLREWRPEDHGQPPGARSAADGRAAPPEDAQNEQLTPEERDARAAASLWNVLCASCHGRGGHGDGPGAPPGAQVADLTVDAYQSSRTDAEIASVITNGQGLMPAFGERLNERGVAALVRHVRRLGGRGPEGVPLNTGESPAAEAPAGEVPAAEAPEPTGPPAAEPGAPTGDATEASTQDGDGGGADQAG